MTRSRAGVKDPGKVQKMPMVFTVTESEKSEEMISECPLQPTCQKLPLVKFWCNMKEYPGGIPWRSGG